MSNGSPTIHDVAIVGAGVAGLYTAWRLSHADGGGEKSIAVYESTDRTGGRLWSVRLRGEDAIPAELGGMFFSDRQHIVFDLCTRELGLKTESVKPRPDFAYLRSKRFRISDFDQPGVPPYHLAPDEQGLPYHQLLFQALQRILPDLEQHWPFDSNGTYADLVQYLRNASLEGRPLYQWGFWNLLARALSNEAYLCLRDIVSSFALFSNWNACDACLSLLGDAHGTWHRLSDGYQELPDSLSRKLEAAGVPIHLESGLVGLEEHGDELIELALADRHGDSRVLARQVILALPKAALACLADKSQLLRGSDMVEHLKATQPEPACKIFLTYDSPWWRDVPDGPGRIASDAYAVSHTDLPMRQCYYLGCDDATGDGLLLASYSDGQSVPFWAALMSPDGRSGLTSDVPEVARKEITRQLSEMHGVEIPPAKSGIFVNWQSEPYGGGWHAWQPGWQSQQMMKSLQRPFDDKAVYVCGEAISAYQGWVEGALTSAEILLRDQFGLRQPDWLSSSEGLYPYTD